MMGSKMMGEFCFMLRQFDTQRMQSDANLAHSVNFARQSDSSRNAVSPI